MRPVSDEFLARVQGPHTVVTVARVHGVDGSVTDIPITEGSVSLDATAAVRGRCDIRVEGTDWVPRDAADKLAPFGAELEIRRGVVLADGSVETVSLGRFGLEDAEITDDGSGAGTRVAALDRAERLGKAKFEDVFQLTSGTPFTEGIQDLALDAWPDCPFMDGFTSVSTISIGRNVTAQPGDDRWEFMQTLALALGMSLFFDGDGVLTLRRYADQSPVASLVEGDGGVLVSASRSWSRTEAYNRWIVTGENTEGSDVYGGVATDDNPLSPTYYYGPFGRCPKFWSSPDIYSDDQAQDVAEAMKAQEIGAASTVNFGLVPNPALEPEDTVRITRGSVGVDENHVIDQLTIGLGATEVMSGSTRERLEL
jgi:hypothetical protein